MTEYGRGPGPEPWHPQDPLYGDGGWEGQPAHGGPQPAYGGRPEQYHPQEPQHQQYPNQQYPNQQYPNQQYPQQQYGDWNQQPQPGYGHDPYPYYDEQGYQQHPGQAQQPYPQQGGWDASGGHGQVPYGAGPGDPYGPPPTGYDGQQPGYHGAENSYPPQPPGGRGPAAEPEPEAAPEEEDHAFFREDGDEDDEEHEPQSRRERRGKGNKSGRKGRKERNGCGCLVVVLVLGGVGTLGYFGYTYYQNRFAPAPDYQGDGLAQKVTVEIPSGAGGWDIGRRLKEAGVVKSAEAFVHAQSEAPGAGAIQAGAYVLNKEMSAASAVRLMLDPKSHSFVLVRPGERNEGVYEAIDKKLELADGTTRKLAEKEYKSFGLPPWAQNTQDAGTIKDPLEGFLFPGTYAAAKGMKPDKILKQMVAQATSKYDAYGLTAKARSLGLDNAFQLVTVASLVQAEGKTSDDFRKMAEVVYNRLKPTNTETNQYLQFDSTYNYAKGTSNIHISEKEINSDQSPYNTYTHKGLPPGPISNPGEDALQAALNPTHDGWIYFVATDGVKNTEFAKTYAEFKQLKEKFNASSGN